MLNLHTGQWQPETMRSYKIKIKKVEFNVNQKFNYTFNIKIAPIFISVWFSSPTVFGENKFPHTQKF